MFMSTRYSKRPEADRRIFSVNDSLAKLCEYLTTEFSSSKLITPKYKDFRSQKLKFDQKTRLNNAIWRAWHIQYKRKQKPRFLQFAAPFSDESSHSTSQAVILEGKYWMKRWDAVSKEYKTWRRVYKEKLLRDGGLDKQDLEDDYEESSSYPDDEEENDRKSRKEQHKKPAIKSIPKTINSVSAMYALPDTLFSSVDNTKNIDIDSPDMSLFKDSSGMYQPTLNHLNPCFDALMENFDFLFTDWENYQPVGNANRLPAMMFGPHQPGTIYPNSQPNVNNNRIFSVDQFLQDENMTGEEEANIVNCGLLTPEKKSENTEFIFPQTHVQQKSASTPANLKDMNEKYQDLPPQLQAPNLAARLQATKPKPITRNKSDPSLSTYLRSNSLPVVSTAASSTVVDTSISCMKGKTRKRQKRSSTSMDTHTKPPPPYPVTRSFEHQESNIRCKTVKYTPTQPATTPQIHAQQSVPILPRINPESSNTTHTPHPPANQQGTIVMGHSVITHPQAVYQQATHTVPAPPQHEAVPVIASPQPTLSSQQQQQQQQAASNNNNNNNNNLLSNLVVPQQVNEQQLLTLAHLLQSTPAQSTEATLSYLELLQQQLNLMLKQQQEQIQLKYHIQAQAEKMIREQQIMQQQQQQQQQTGVITSPQIVQTTQLPEKHQQQQASVMTDTTANQQPVVHNRSAQLITHSSVYEQKKDMDKTESSPSNPSTQQMSWLQKSFKDSPPANNSVITTPSQISSSNIYIPTQHLTPKLQVEERPANTMDSAMALVSLRHGQSKHSDDSLQVNTTVGPNNDDITAEIHSSKIQQATPEVRRQCHLSAEQKRRGIIKDAFEELASMVPNPGGGRSRLSNAAILQKTCEHIMFLQRERAACDARLNLVQKQIDDMNASISEFQNQLPASGLSASRKGSDTVEKGFFTYCKELIYKSGKSWITFCAMMKPIFESYNQSVSTKTVDEFLDSVIRWLDQHCSLALLRPVVLNTLTKLSTNTSFLEDPSCLNDIAKNALSQEDPTVLPTTQRQKETHNEASSSNWSSKTEMWKNL